MGMVNRTWETIEKNKYDNAYLKGYPPGRASIREFEHRVCSVIKKYAKTRVKLLDVGCGPAYVNEIAKNYDIEMMGMDISSVLIPYWNYYKVPALVASAAHMPFKNDVFDFIMCWEVMEHIPEEGVQDVFKEIFRVGKDGSLFSFSINLEDCFISKYGEGELGELHVTVKRPGWWISKLKNAGFIFNVPPGMDLDNLLVSGSFSGVAIVAK